jgi:hypothetical protein
MQNNRDASYFAQFESSIRQDFESRLGESYAIDSALESGKAFSFLFRVFDSPKEVLKGFMHPVRNILLRLRMNLTEYASKIFIKVKLIQRYLPIFPRVYGHSKKLVIDCLACFKRINDAYLLLARRVNPEFIHPQFHLDIVNSNLFNIFGFHSHLYPTSKEGGFYMGKTIIKQRCQS